MDYEHFMKQALEQAENAFSAGEFPVGCVMVYEDRILVTGSRMGTSGALPNEIDHAEMVVLRRLVDLEENIDHSRITLFTTMEPCLMCLGALVLSGIGEIVYAYEDVMGGGTGCHLDQMAPLYKNHTLSVIPNVLRDESLALFKDYFQNPKNFYWRGSLLAEYTLRQ